MYTILISVALAGLALLAWGNYRWAVTLLAGLLPTYLLRLTSGPFPTNFFELGTLVVLLAGVLQPTVRRSWATTWHMVSPIAKALVIGFVVACGLAVSISFSVHGLGILKGWIIVPLIFGWLVAVATRADEQLKKRSVAALLGSGLVVAVIGLWQLGSEDRVTSIYDVPNSLALFLVPLVVVATWQKRWLVAGVLMAALIATQSVTAMAALVVTLVIGWLVWRRSISQRIVVAVAAVLLVATGYYLVTGRLAYLVAPLLDSGQHNSVSVRGQLWRVSGQLIKERPWTGYGLGEFEPNYQRKLHEWFREYEAVAARYNSGHEVAQPLREFVFRDPHNWVLSFWINTGLLGLVSFVGLNALALRRGSRYDAIASTTSYPAITLALTSLLLFGLVDTIYWKNDLAALHWLLLWWLLTSVSPAPSTLTPTPD